MTRIEKLHKLFSDARETGAIVQVRKTELIFKNNQRIINDTASKYGYCIDMYGTSKNGFKCRRKQYMEGG